MRKIGVLLFAAVFCLSLLGCNQSKSTPTESIVTETLQAQSTTVPKTTIPETTIPETTIPPTTNPPKEIHWTEEFYVDDFGDPTNESYIRGIFYGTFSNSAASGSPLTVCFFMDKNLASASYDMFTIRLLEYGNQKVNFIGCDESDITIKVKIDGVVIEDEADYLLPNSGEIVLQRGNAIFKAVLNALDADKEIAFVITVNSYGVDTYRFDIDANGLADIPHTWKGTM